MLNENRFLGTFRGQSKRPTGKYLSPDVMSVMMTGQDENWCKLKSRILQIWFGQTME